MTVAIAAALAGGAGSREPQWSERVTVGRWEFLERIASELGTRALRRKVEDVGGDGYVLWEAEVAYRPFRGARVRR